MLSFDKQAHVYKWGDKVIPSVTQILKGVGIIEDKFYTDDAREKGTYVHAVLEMIDRNPDKRIDYDESVSGYVKAWGDFKRDNVDEILEIEKPMFFDDYLFAGTLDRIVKLKNVGNAVIDIKTGASQRWHELQTAGYELLAFDKQTTPRACVYLSEDGRYQIKRHQFMSDFRVFMSAVSIFKWKGESL